MMALSQRHSTLNPLIVELAFSERFRTRGVAMPHVIAEYLRCNTALNLKPHCIHIK